MTLGGQFEVTAVISGIRRATCVAMVIVTIATVACGGSEESRIRQGNETIAAGGDRGRDNRQGTVSVFEIRKGDCFINSARSQVNEVNLVACSEVWDFRVTDTLLVDRDGDYPGSPLFEQEAVDRCGGAASTFLYPTTASWDIGDRVIVCLEEG